MDKLQEWLGFLAANAGDPVVWSQFVTVLAIVAIVWFAEIRLKKVILAWKQDKSGLTRFTYGAGERIVAPLLALLLFSVARAVVEQLEYQVVLLDVAIPLALSLAIIRTAVYLLRKAFRESALLIALENTIVTLIWVGVAMHFLGWLPAVMGALDSMAINFGESRISLLGVIKTVLSVAFFLLFAVWLSALLEKRLHRSKSFSLQLKVAAAKSSRIILLTIGFLIALDTIGIDLTALTVLGGALGVGVGFGLQRIASNFISGFILLFDRSIKPGDVISVGESFGWVQQLHARYVVIRDRSGVERLIPNENLITSEVINWSYTDRNIRLKIPVQVSYQSDPEQAMAIMLESANEGPRVLKQPEPVVRMLAFADNGIELELRVWIQDPEQGVNNVRSDINMLIWKKFREHDIEIPYPQRDVHLRNLSGNAVTLTESPPS